MDNVSLPCPNYLPLGQALELSPHLPSPVGEKGTLAVALAPDIPIARGRPVWEAPPPDRGFPRAPKEIEVLLGIYKGTKTKHRV